MNLETGQIYCHWRMGVHKDRTRKRENGRDKGLVRPGGVEHNHGKHTHDSQTSVSFSELKVSPNISFLFSPCYQLTDNETQSWKKIEVSEREREREGF